MKSADVPSAFCQDRCAAWCSKRNLCGASHHLRSLRMERGEDPDECHWPDDEIKRHRPQEAKRRRAA